MVKTFGKKYSLTINLLKTITYGLLGTISTVVVQSIGEGVDYKTALITGIGIGVIAGIKNLIKHTLGVDLDLARIKKTA